MIRSSFFARWFHPFAGLALLLVVGLAPSGAAAQAPVSAAIQAVLDYAQAQKTTGFLMIQNRTVIVERNWPVPTDAPPTFKPFTYGETKDGALLEDVASQQKSFVSALVAIGIDKGLIDVTKPVSAYIGSGWSKASPEQEGRITVLNLLNMNSGLAENFTYVAEPGAQFSYNTPAYAVTKRVLAAAAHASLDDITHDWLTGPLGMTDTAWRKRPGAFADVGNPTGLVTSPRDTAKFGQMLLDKGRAADGARVVSEAGMAAMFERTATNPAYGRL